VLVDNSALCELVTGDIAPLVRVKFGINLVSLVLIAFILFLLILSLFCLDLCLCSLFVRDHLQDSPGHISELLIQTDSSYSSQILYLVLVSLSCRKFRLGDESSGPSELPTQDRKFRKI